MNRIATVDEELVEQYNCIAAPLLTISRQLQKSLLQQLKDRQRGGKQTGLMMGRRLDAHALCRNDGKVFYKNALPNEIPQMAVALLLDESGSMGSYDRCTYARASAIILYYDFDQDYYLGLATILKEVIQEAEHVELTACDDYDGAEYLLFEPLYPWQIREEERFLTEEKIAKLLRKYIQILSDSVLEIEHQSVENGG